MIIIIFHFFLYFYIIDVCINCRIDLKASTIEKISFSCKVALDFKLLLVQAKTKGKGWFPIPREMHRSHQDGCNFHVEFTELNSTKSYSFRLLGIDTKNKQQYVLSCSSIKPIGEYPYIQRRSETVFSESWNYVTYLLN